MSDFSGRDAQGNKIVGIGIVKKTYSRLLEGEMLVVDLSRLGIPKTKLVILGGTDDAEISRHLQNTITQRTKVHVDPAAIIHKAG